MAKISKPPGAAGSAPPRPNSAGPDAAASPARLLLAALDQHALTALASLPADPAFCPPTAHTLVLVGPVGGLRWWHSLQASAEWRDGLPDPIDRWSKRVIGTIAASHGGAALFPSDGPPYPPFLHWARLSGQLWSSPVGMLVHGDAGLWVSFRGALALPFALPLPARANPCDSCIDQPCRTQCPVNALGQPGYDTAACHRFLDSPAGQDCMSQGCAARRACPHSKSHARSPQQSAYHMRQFHR